MSLLKSKKKKNNIIIQENPEECIKLVENVFFKGLFSESVTDISYNGSTFFAQNNEIGRYKLDLKWSSDDILTFIKKTSNYMLQPFSSKVPILDVSFGDYRLSAIHPNYARTNNKKVVTFSLRKITATIKIKENDESLCPIEVHKLLKALIRSYESILISGQTGSGKTEFQKFLISLMNKSDRVILIEESYETHIKEIYQDMDVTSWIVNNSRDELSFLVKTALRNNPDWIIIAETRGIEAYDMLQAAMTGHSAITTIHSESAKYSLDRIVNICKKSIDIDEQLMSANIAKHIRIGIHMEKMYDNSLHKIVRRISEIVEYIPQNEGYHVNMLYEIVKSDTLKEKKVYGCISDELKKTFIKHDVILKDINKFIKKEKE